MRADTLSSCAARHPDHFLPQATDGEGGIREEERALGKKAGEAFQKLPLSPLVVFAPTSSSGP